VPPSGVDYFDIDSLLSEEERMIRDTVREWVDDALLPVIERRVHRAPLPARS
jgi:glutaryl-CoA dehydrogenase